MDDIDLMGGGETGGDVFGQTDDRPHVGLGRRQIGGQLFALDVFHDDKIELEAGVGIGGGIDFVNGHDVGVRDTGGSPGFAIEAFFAFGIFEIVGQQNFQGHLAAQLGIFGEIDLAHTAGAEAFYDSEVPKSLTIFKHQLFLFKINKVISSERGVSSTYFSTSSTIVRAISLGD